ncbi:MAG: hypothetical protein K0R22_1149 [Sporomusa sp.]|jgi:hypothetical protein|nr:hypothetical protein [Sporomusa sp.]
MEAYRFKSQEICRKAYSLYLGEQYHFRTFKKPGMTLGQNKKTLTIRASSIPPAQSY